MLETFDCIKGALTLRKTTTQFDKEKKAKKIGTCMQRWFCFLGSPPCLWDTERHWIWLFFVCLPCL